MLPYYFLFLSFFTFFCHSMNDPRSPLDPPSPATQVFHAFAGSPSTSTGLLFLDTGQQRRGEEWHNKVIQEETITRSNIPDTQEPRSSEPQSLESTTQRHSQSTCEHTPHIREVFTTQRNETNTTLDIFNDHLERKTFMSRIRTPQRCILLSTFIVCTLNLGFTVHHHFSATKCIP